VASVDTPTLFQFVVLSMLLHVLLIVLFGNAPGTGSRRSEGWWGNLEVTLRRLAPEASPGFRLEREVDRGSRGLAPRPEAAPKTQAQPAARAAQPEPSGEPAPEVAPLTPPPVPLQAPPREKAETQPEVERVIVPAPLSVEPIAPRRSEQELAPPMALPPRETPIAPSAPIEKLAPPRGERQIVPPVALPPRETPIAPSAPIERLAPARVEPEFAQPVELPRREVPVAPGAPIEGIAPPRAEREIAAPAAIPPREVPAVPSTTIESITPRGQERELVPAAPAVTPSAPAPAPARTVAPTTASPQGPSAPAEEQPRIEFRAPLPSPEEELFKSRRDVVTPATEPGGTPHIDRQASRERAREIAGGRSGSRGVFTLAIPIPPESKTKEAVAIEKAARPDCRSAYSDLGLLAVPALVANTLTDSGCKW
jgi:hypothetical protein